MLVRVTTPTPTPNSSPNPNPNQASCREEDMELEHFDEGVKHDVS